VSVAVRFSGAVTYPIERRRTVGSVWEDPADAPWVAGGVAPSGAGPATAGGGAAVGAAATSGEGAATEGEVDGLQRSTRARGGSPALGVLGAAGGRVAGAGSRVGCRRSGWDSGRRGPDASRPPRIGATLAAATASPAISAHLLGDQSRGSAQWTGLPPAGVSFGSRSRSASRIVLTSPRPSGS
jgi:hypothetical protein